MYNPRNQQKSIVILLAFFSLILIYQLIANYGTAHLPASISSYAPSSLPGIPTAIGGKTRGKHAFVVFLNANPSTKSKSRRDIPRHRELKEIQDEDHYFQGTRMLLYQLLHNPETATNTSVDFVVLVQKEVPESNREQLRSEGAIVKEVEDVKLDWIQPGRDRWAHVMTKLRVYQLVEYEKVLLMDSDIVVLQRIDAIFDDPAAQVFQNLNNASNVMDDEAPQPSSYIMAGNSGPAAIEHDWPGERGNRLNAGFVILQPSEEMFQHQYSVASIEGRFFSGSPEQNLWNYVYDRNRNMPWKQVDPIWTANTVVYNDYLHGVKTMHEKYWRIQRDPELRDVLLRVRWQMEGYFNGYHERRAAKA